MTKLSVNINKIATIRNARGGNNPDILHVALDCERFGADGITVHPRPDERHIRRDDVINLKPILTTEFNIEGNPQPAFVELVKSVRPTQVTLVPDSPGQITSNAGWDTRTHFDFLSDIVADFKALGIRTSIFIGTDPELIELCRPRRTLHRALRNGLRQRPRRSRRPLRPRRRSGPKVRPRPQCRTRPLAPQPRLLPPTHPLARRSQHRPRTHLRRPLPRTGGDHPAVQSLPRIILQFPIQPIHPIKPIKPPSP